jgi:hypothetical protein
MLSSLDKNLTIALWSGLRWSIDLSLFTRNLHPVLSMTEEVELQRRCDQNRKRSKRRAIFCPIHNSSLHSVSQKYALYADQVEHLQQRGMGRRQAMLSISVRSTVSLHGEWIEAFWCDECQTTEWYYVRKFENNCYAISLAPSELWQQAAGVIHPHGNPSVSEFTRNQSRMGHHPSVKDFRAIS